MRDRVGFATQDECRRFFNDVKSKGTVQRKATIALPAFGFTWFLNTENERFYDDPYDADDPIVFWFLDEFEPEYDICKGIEKARGILIFTPLVSDARTVKSNKQP